MKEIYESDVYPPAENLLDLVRHEYDNRPSKAQYTTGHPIVRSADRIAAHITEGYRRWSPADRKRLDPFSRGSFEKPKR